VVRNTKAASDYFESISKGTDLMVKEARTTFTDLDTAARRADALLIDLQKFSTPLGERGPGFFKSFDQTSDQLNRLFPTMRRIDLERFPRPDDLERELGAACFDLRLERLSQRTSMTREHALERIRGRHISTFQLIGDDEYGTGLGRAERELPERVDYAQEWLLVAAERR
jgi:hypothetical protein